MATPTIANTGLNSNMIVVTNDKGVEYNVPLGLAVFVDSSNDNVSRVDLQYGRYEIPLIFADSDEVTTFLTAMRALY